MNHEEIVRNSFTLWTKDTKSIKYMFFFLASEMLFYILLLGFAALFFKDIFEASVLFISSGPASGLDPVQLEALTSSFIANFIPFLLVVVPLYLLFAAVAAYIRALMMVRAMELLNIRAFPFGPAKLVRLILLSIWISIASLISLYHKKFFLFFLALVGFSALTLLVFFLNPVIAVLMVILLGFAAIPYIFMVFYNNIRLSMSPVIFLEKEQGILETASEGWKLGEGKVMEIFTGFLIVGIIIFIASFVVGIGVLAVQLLVEAALGKFAGIAIQQLANILLAPIWAVIGAFVAPAIYLGLQRGLRK